MEKKRSSGEFSVKEERNCNNNFWAIGSVNVFMIVFCKKKGEEFTSDRGEGFGDSSIKKGKRL